MAILRVQHIYRHKNEIAKDVYVNTFHFQTPNANATPTLADAAVDIVDDFYNVAHDPALAGYAPGAICHFIAQATLVPKRDSYKVYDLSEPKPRAPMLEEERTPVQANDPNPSNIPAEVAVALSYSAAKGGGIPARRRGRIYLGPFLTKILSTTPQKDSRPGEDFLRIACKAGYALMNAATARGLTWVTYSPTNDAAYPIVEVSCDNAWDTQRRRGIKPSDRTSLSGFGGGEF